MTRLLYWSVLVLFILALILMQFLIGGTRLLFSLPSYGLLAIAALLSPALLGKKQIPPNVFCIAATVLFVSYIILRALTSPVNYLAREDLYMALGGFIVYLLTSLHMSSPKSRWIVLFVFLGLLIANGFWGMMQYMRQGKVILFSFLEPADYGWRATGLFICPNHLAGFLEMIILLGLSLVFWSRRRIWVKLITAYALVIGLVAFVMTGSRGGYISLFFGLALFAVLSLYALYCAEHPRFKQVLASLVLLGLAGGVGMGYFVSQSFALQTRTAGLNNSGQVRLEMWQAALEQTKLAPVLGTGTGTYEYLGRYFRDPSVQADPVHVHNDYLELLAEYGVIGVILLLPFLLTHTWSGWKTFRFFVTERGQKIGRIRSDALALNIGAFCSLVTLGIHSTMDFNMHIPANVLTTAFCLGILCNPGVSMPYPEFIAPKALSHARWVAPLAGVWILVVGLPTLPGEYFAEQSRKDFRDGYVASAFDMAEFGLDYDLKNPYLYRYLGQSLVEAAPELARNDPDGTMEFLLYAVDTFREGLKYYPQDIWMVLGAGEALTLLGEGEEALGYYEDAIGLDPKSASVRAQYAKHLHHMGQYEKAMEEYQLSEKLFPNHMARLGMYNLERDMAERRRAMEKEKEKQDQQDSP